MDFGSCVCVGGWVGGWWGVFDGNHTTKRLLISFLVCVNRDFGEENILHLPLLEKLLESIRI